MRKWITQKEVNKILRTYSIRKNEFLPIDGKEYFYQSQIVKGYTITISEEIEQGKNYSEKTGRIVVAHTQWNGRKAFNDIWEREKNGTLQFRFRNLWNQPTSDIAYMQELEKQNGQLSAYIEEMHEQFSSVQKVSQESQLLITDTTHTNDFEQMQEQLKLLEEENQRLKRENIHNARGAGRKPSKKRSDAIQQMRELIHSGYNEKEIIEKLGISRSTFFRYKKVSIINL